MVREDTMIEQVRDHVKKLLDVDDPLKQGFGFVAVWDGQVAAHAMVDFIYGKEGDIGLFTQQTHRRKGLAPITSAAAIEYGLANGLERIWWDCHTENAGSVRTSEKLGLVHDHDYMMHYFDF